MEHNLQSLNSAAEAGALSAWSSWTEGVPPQGYFLPDHLSSVARFFAENGYLVLQNGLNSQEVDMLNTEAALICQGERGHVPGFSPAVDGETREDVMRKYLCIHFPHKISPLMERTLHHPSILGVLTRVIGPNVKCMQSMLFIKASGKPGQAWHQDEFFIPTRDRSLLGAWIALDDATVENGCLWVLPGSHRRGIIYDQHTHNDRRFDCSGEAEGFDYSNDEAVPVEVKAGSIVFFNGYLLHRSLPNTSHSGFRRSLVNHYMSAESLLPWYGENLPKGTHVGLADNRDVVLVAGHDPYQHKGLVSNNRPHVRASGEGGCGKGQEEAPPAENAPFDED